MLNRQQLKDYRMLRGLSMRDVAQYSEITQPLISQIEKGTRELTEYNHWQIINGINLAYEAKQNGTFEKPPRVNVSHDKENKPEVNKEGLKAPKRKNSGGRKKSESK